MLPRIGGRCPLLPDVGAGCSHGQDAESAAILESKMFTAVKKFLTTSPLVNKVKFLMVSRQLSNYPSVFLLLPLSRNNNFGELDRLHGEGLALYNKFFFVPLHWYTQTFSIGTKDESGPERINLFYVAALTETCTRATFLDCIQFVRFNRF